MLAELVEAATGEVHCRLRRLKMGMCKGYSGLFFGSFADFIQISIKSRILIVVFEILLTKILKFIFLLSVNFCLLGRI